MAGGSEKAGPDPADATEVAETMASGPGGALPAGAEGLEVDASGRYQLGDVHAAGGLGRIVRAHDRRLGRTVAVKELLQRTPNAETRFVREALITARLEHPGIVPVHDAGRWPSGEPYYSMKLVSGRTLKDLLAAGTTLDARMALLPNVLAVAEAIAYAHSKDVIHRDIKPPNVIVGDFGETIVIDWGLAKDLSGRVAEPEPGPIDPVGATLDSGGSGSGASGPDVTAIGNVMGTPSYMAPEQARGAEVDARADVYALGALLYELLVGEPPYTGRNSEEILARAVIAEPVPVEARQPSAAPDLVAVVEKAMAREPRDRYQTAIEMAEDLRRFQTGQLVTARQYSRGTLLRRWVARHRGMVAVSGLAVVALAVIGTVSVRRVMTERDVAMRERGTAMRASRTAEERGHELLFQRATSATSHDPTLAVALLKNYPVEGKSRDQLVAIADAAEAAGVARHVLVHDSEIMDLAMAPDGTLLSVANGRVRRFDLATGVGVVTTLVIDGAIKSLSPDASLLAVAQVNRTMALYPVGDGPRRELGAFRGDISTEFSPDGRRLFSVDLEQVARVWDVASGRELIELRDVAWITPGHDGESIVGVFAGGDVSVVPLDGGRPRKIGTAREPITLLRASDDGRWLAVHDAVSLRVFDLRGGPARDLGPREMVRGSSTAAFEPGGTRLALGNQKGVIWVVDLATGSETAVLRGHDDAVLQLHFTPDRRFLISVSDDTTARVWNLDTGEARILRGHRDDVWRLAVSPDGKVMATGSLDGTVRVWPVEEKGVHAARGVVGETRGIAFSRDGRTLFIGGRDGSGTAVDVASGAIKMNESGKPSSWRTKRPPGFGTRVVAWGSEDGRVTLFDSDAGVERELPKVHSSFITAVALTLDDSLLLSAEESGRVLLWNVASGSWRELMRRRVDAARFTPDGKQVYLAGDGFIELWDHQTGTKIVEAELAGYGALDVRSMDLAAGGDAVMVTGLAGPIASHFVWNRRSGHVEPFGGRTAGSTLALAPDGTKVGVAGVTRTVSLWEEATGDERVIGKHDDFVYAVTFSPDGSVLASASYDRTARLWHLATGRVRILRGHTSSVNHLAYSPDGSTLATVTATGVVRFWSLAHRRPDDPSVMPTQLGAATTAVIGADDVLATPAPR